MKLEMMTEEDVGLRVRLETDPQMMAGLGGPRPREAVERAHAKSLALAAEGRCWPLKIIPDGGSSPAGGVDVFESSHDDEAIYEIGWMILPGFQNRGIASQAVREVLERARGERKFGQIHAFPAVTNGPSNKICEKTGFTNLGQCEVEFAGRGLRCNHWRIDLWDDAPLAEHVTVPHGQQTSGKSAAVAYGVLHRHVRRSHSHQSHRGHRHLVYTALALASRL